MISGNGETSGRRRPYRRLSCGGPGVRISFLQRRVRANLEAPLCANHASPAHRRRPLAVGAYTLLEQQTLFDPTCKSPPPSEPANRWFLRQSGTGRMTRSTGLLSSSMRPSSRRRESAGHRVSALRIASAGSPRAFFVRFWSRHSRARLAAGRSSWRRARVAKPFPT